MSVFRCQQCKNRIVQKSGDGVSVRAQGKITFDAEGVCHAQCFFCKSDVVLPLELSKSATIEERYVVDVTRVSRAK
jgi:hypothetical protein